MRIRRTSYWLLILNLSFVALAAGEARPGEAKEQQRTPSTAAPSGASKIDPAKEADIRRLLGLTGGAAMADQMMTAMIGNMRPMMTNALPPGDYRERLLDIFFEKFRAKADTRQLLDMAVPIYDKYLSREDVLGLIQFYGTPLGQKALSVLPKLSLELQGEGLKWGERLGRESMVELLTEHPDLAAALEAAAKQGANPR